MFLKNLRIKGFKSFADPCELDLEPGVTVVVGPNGSGKSNVVDAIGWVLGAQAPSAVRSQKMDDVIFAGTSGRPALGRAEVSLTIDNSAGILPIEFTEVTISRLLFRNGDSEYAINGAPSRLLDIQELLSDSGVGRQQHVIVSQGNIDGVLNARPEDRRLIVEEAAGVLKYRRRKERSERRLASTEANLTRITDLLREVRRQLKPLERQADAARRHGDLVAELTALRMHLAGREIARLRTQLSTSRSTQVGLREQADRIRANLADLDARVTSAEAELGTLGMTDTGETLMRLETLRERGTGQIALLHERGRSISAALDATVDAAVVASMESEAATLRSESADLDSEAESLRSDSDALDAREAELASRFATFEAEWGDGVPAPTGEAAVLRSELSGVRESHRRTQEERESLQTRHDSLSERLGRLAEERSAATAELGRAESERDALADAERAARTALGVAEVSSEQRDARRRAAEADLSAWLARTEALTLALADAHERAGSERLAGSAGVLGTLVDLVEVDPGWEEAFEAAAADAMGAVVVADFDAARDAIASLVEGDHRGAVLALGALGPTPVPPVPGEPVRAHVRASAGALDRGGVNRLLDSLLGGSVVAPGGWREAAELAASHPGAVVVTNEGHRFAPGGWRLGAAGSGATAAALEEATEATSVAEAGAGEAGAAAESAREVMAAAREACAEAVRRRDGNEATMLRSSEMLARLDRDHRDTARDLDAVTEALAAVDQRDATETARVGDLESALPRLEAEEAELAERAASMNTERESLEHAAALIRSQRTDADVREAAAAERRRYVADRLGHLTERLSNLAEETSQAAARRLLLEVQAEAVGRLSAFVKDRMTAVESLLARHRDERRRQSESARLAASRLEELRRERSTKERELEEVRSRVGKAEVADAEARTRLDTAMVTLRTELDVEPDVAEAAECPLLPEGVTAPAHTRALERELRAMGPINPLALQEHEELSERHDFLEAQLQDVRQSRRELSKVIKAVDEEIVKVFSAAFADVSENFTYLFETLFPGGTGRLRLAEPGDLLGTGIEIEAKPSGKNVKKLSLLSGGERSLTALAYLFAVFRSRPSPFYVMDEVEAALDDVNLHRFLDLIGEFRASAQLLIVSHQKRTMEAADVLYGVSMAPGGSSKVIAERAADVVDVR